ncbi:MAG TPA: hypothetical protein VHX61_09150 [Rhizomicrobium sp.]|jgi:hypothetical protein|nr:hypothetical protein [Rhizomicrobium sp.]
MPQELIGLGTATSVAKPKPSPKADARALKRGTGLPEALCAKLAALGLL